MVSTYARTHAHIHAHARGQPGDKACVSLHSGQVCPEPTSPLDPSTFLVCSPLGQQCISAAGSTAPKTVMGSRVCSVTGCLGGAQVPTGWLLCSTHQDHSGAPHARPSSQPGALPLSLPSPQPWHFPAQASPQPSLYCSSFSLAVFVGRCPQHTGDSDGNSETSVI